MQRHDSKILIFLFCFIQAFALKAEAFSFDQPVKSSSVIQNFTIPLLLKIKCETFLNRLARPQAGVDAKMCSQAAKRFMSELDSQVVSKTSDGTVGYASVAFRKTFETWLHDPRLLPVLNHVQLDLDAASALGTRFSLFESVQDLLQTRESTLEFIAVVLQDLGHDKAQIEWARARYENDSVIMSRLQKLNTFINHFTQTLEHTSHRSSIHLYPKAEMSDELLGDKIYHFYVPAYLSSQMRESGVAAQASAFGSFYFNFAYEAFKEGWTWQLAFSDPQHLTAGSDVVAGMSGALYGLNPELSPIDLHEMARRMLSHSTDATVEFSEILNWYFSDSRGF